MKKAKNYAKIRFPGWLLYLLRALIKIIKRNYELSFSNASSNSSRSPYSFIISRDNILEKLGEKYLPSKRAHNYLIYYWKHFRDIHSKVKNVLEIGLQTDNSLRMWEENYPNAIIY